MIKIYNLKLITQGQLLQGLNRNMLYISLRQFTQCTKYQKFNQMDLAKPIASFFNSDTSKNNIFELANDNNSQRAVYCGVNNINKKSYVGSSVDLTVRLYKYYKFRYLSNSKSPINKSLLKCGYSNFSFHIMEYCPYNNCIDRQQYYIDLINPLYNVLKKGRLFLRL